MRKRSVRIKYEVETFIRFRHFVEEKPLVLLADGIDVESQRVIKRITH